MFTRRGKNLIDWVREKETDKWQSKNLTSINSSGIELNGNFYPEKIWNKSIFLTKLGINYCYTELDKGDNNLFSNYVLDNLKHKFDVEVNHKIWNNVKGSWRFSYQDRNGMRTKTESYEPFWQINTRLIWKTPSTEIYAMVANLLNTTYYDMGTVLQPGRWISFGISHQIKFR